MAKKSSSVKDEDEKPSKPGQSKGEIETHHKGRFTFGLILSIIAIYLAVAFTSFLFSGAEDRSKFDKGLWALLKNKEADIQNVTGPIGAYLSDMLFNNWFGLSSFIIPFILFLIGARLLGFRILPMRKSIAHSFIVAIWLSVTLGFIFIKNTEDNYLLLGGAHGYLISEWLSNSIGGVGTALLILITFLIYMGITFDWFIPLFKNSIKKAAMAATAKREKEASKKEKEKEKEAGLIAPIAEPIVQSNNEEPEFISKLEKTFGLDEEGLIENDFLELEDDETNTQPVPIVKATPLVNHASTDDGLVIERPIEDVVPEDYSHEVRGDYDPTLDLSHYELPPVSLLAEFPESDEQVSMQELEANKLRITKTLEDYNIKIIKTKATVGPTVTLYEIIPEKGVRISKITNLENDIALSLAALGIRIIGHIPGKGTIGIEVPNNEPKVVSMRSIINSAAFRNSKYELPIALGKTISNETYMMDLTKAPHLLVAGATGQGKSVGLNVIITSLLYSKHPSALKFVLIDPKKVELNIYSRLEKHFLAKLPGEEEAIITDVQKVVSTLNSLTIEMDTRYNLLKAASCRTIKEYNGKFVKRMLNPLEGHRFLPYIVVIIDEFADLIMTAGKEVEMPIGRIAQLARAVGIHMIIATQRPSTNIITGVIKANFPTRIAFKVASMIDSRTILDTPGANQLIGRGDMLVSAGGELVRVQCAFVDTPEVEQIADFIGKQAGYGDAYLLPENVGESAGDGGELDNSKRDTLLEEAARYIITQQTASTSTIQRRFSIGYNRAGRMMDQLEALKIVGPPEGSKPRQILIYDENSLDRIFSKR
ncbi:MAG: DNA translocase FtsK 4TM domain-containing protein [Breznakibacter sp.]|nr:DNA translocase FtsK 4TM domain-containing protein [Breznakibacter sp.]